MLFFVYGTLRRGQRAERFWSESAGVEYLGSGRTRGLMFHLGGFPGCVFHPATPSFIVGDVIEVNDQSIINRFDQYEGFEPNDRINSLYIRKEVELEDGRTVQTYEYNHPVPVKYQIKSGDWTKQEEDAA